MGPNLSEGEYLSFSRVLVPQPIPSIPSLHNMGSREIPFGGLIVWSWTMKPVYRSDLVSDYLSSLYFRSSNTNTTYSTALDPNDHPNISSVYPKKFALCYVVTLAEHQLSTDLHVENTSESETLEFQALLHNYLRVPADDVSIAPLQGLSFYDKTETTEEARAKPKLESRDKVDVKKFTDSVYENSSGKYDVVWPSGNVEVKAKGFKDVVVWNPQEEGVKIGDMEADGW